MANILPFKGIRYNPEKITDFSKVITPPYDVISDDERENYYQLHPNSIIRLILGKDLPGDNDSTNKYTRAADFFGSWRNDEVLIQETEPAIYVYAQEFTLENKKYTRKGIISLVKLEDFKTGRIYPHEHTLAKPKEDRLKLMQSCDANFSQVFAFFEDNDCKVSGILNNKGGPNTGIPPEIDFTDIYGVRNILWPIRDKEILRELMSLMEQKPLFIADGHHRYETALFYRDYVKGLNQSAKDANDNSHSPPDYLMMMSVPMNDPGLIILPTHRLVKNINNIKAETIIDSLNEVFEVKDMGQDCRTESLMHELSKNINEHAFILYIGEEEKRFYSLKVRDKAVLHKIFEDEFSEWKSIDTGILHGFILDKILGLKAENTSKSENIKYLQGVEDAVTLVNEDKYQLAFFLNPTRIEQIRDIAIKRHKMPPKATYFYPKLMTGMVLRHIS